MTARELVWDMLIQVNEKDELSHHALNAALSECDRMEAPLSEQERAFATRLFHGTLERQITIDWVIERQAKRAITKIKPKIRNLLRLSVYQLLYMQKIPGAAACNEAVELAKKHKLNGLAGFVNGVLRGLEREITACGGQTEFLRAMSSDMTETERLCFLYSMPVWLVTYWRNTFPKVNPETMMTAFLQDGNVTVRCNKSRGTVTELMKRLAEEGAAPTQGILPNCIRLTGSGNPAGLSSYRDGLFSIQDQSAILAGNVLPLQAGMNVLDLCAAPGGKTIHAADELTVLEAERNSDEDPYQIISRDVKEQKLAKIREHAERVHLEGIVCDAKDAAEYDEMLSEWADLVIADVPCSGLGVIGRKPDIKMKTELEDIRSLAEIQKKIVTQAIRYLKPGGYLAYSTCTVTAEENREMSAFIQSLGLKPVDLRGLLPKELRKSGYQKSGQAADGIQIFPEPDKWDGFYIAGFRK